MVKKTGVEDTVECNYAFLLDGLQEVVIEMLYVIFMGICIFSFLIT